VGESTSEPEASSDSPGSSLGCGEHTITAGETYSIESPNYPDKYGEKDSCKWEFTCDDSAGVIGISCDEFKTEEADPCEDADYLRVTDSTGDLGNFCGKTAPDLKSADNTLELKFKTDKDDKTKDGFSCSVLCEVGESTSEPEASSDSPGSSLGCGEHTITAGETYSIESPNYPDKYGEKDSCKWEFNCDDSAGVISVSCDEFKTEEDDPCEDADYLRVTDSTGEIGNFCGKDGPDLESADNFLELKFKTDNDGKTKDGFSCSVLCSVPASTTEPPFSTPGPSTSEDEDATTTPSGGWSGECSGTLTAYHNMEYYWESPNYDGVTHYPHGDYCCSFNITIPASLPMFICNMEMMAPSSIHETSQCKNDHIAYTSAAKHTSIMCGELGGQQWSEVAAYNGPRKFHFTWCSTDNDRYKTDIGFKMEITGFDMSLG